MRFRYIGWTITLLQSVLFAIFVNMETIPKEECIKVGFFKKTHGVFGELVLEFESQYEFSVESANRFFVELDGLLVPFFVLEDGFRFKTENSAIIIFDGVDSENYARRMVGSSVFLFENEIVDVSDELFESELVDYLLVDEKLGEIGIIRQIDNYSGNVVLTVDYRHEELLVPFNEDLMISVDRKNKTLKLKLPEGLIEDTD